MIKRYHEAPIAIFKDVQQVTDGDYALVHLFETNQEYYDMFKEAVEQGRDVILDNSIFELGTAFNGDRFAYWINQLRPTWYIVPDCWKDSEKTCQMFDEFTHQYHDLPGKIIGVAQGNVVEDVAQSYNYLKDKCDMIAFNLDFSSFFYRQLPEEARQRVPYCLAMSYGRYMILNDLDRAGVIDHTKQHHLLGCGVPQEASWYAGATWIRSIDTSSPVTNGMDGTTFSVAGVQFKPKQKMCDCIDYSIGPVTKSKIMHNIAMMSLWCSK